MKLIEGEGCESMNLGWLNEKKNDDHQTIEGWLKCNVMMSSEKEKQLIMAVGWLNEKETKREKRRKTERRKVALRQWQTISRYFRPFARESWLIHLSLSLTRVRSSVMHSQLISIEMFSFTSFKGSQITSSADERVCVEVKQASYWHNSRKNADISCKCIRFHFFLALFLSLFSLSWLDWDHRMQSVMGALSRIYTF